jgi:hypothetical protein
MGPGAPPSFDATATAMVNLNLSGTATPGAGDASSVPANEASPTPPEGAVDGVAA